MKTIPMQFDISKSPPNVLLVGNGILKSEANINNLDSKSWEDKILCLSDDAEKYRDEFKDVPYSIRATIVADVDDNKRQNRYVEVFDTLKFQDASLLNDLVTLQFDCILTTNYTYEIENCFLPGYSDLKDKLKFSRTIVGESSKKVDTKYLLHTFNLIENHPPVWHIHGENRRKSSVVLTHDEYSRLICKLVEENKLNQNKYVDCETELIYDSWLDYLLVSNLYIIGLGFDFSEFDLWWILNRRMREKGKVGKIIFFESTNMEKSRKNAIEALGVKVKQFADVKADDYITLYKRATAYIRDSLKG